MKEAGEQTREATEATGEAAEKAKEDAGDFRKGGMKRAKIKYHMILTRKHSDNVAHSMSM